MLPRRSAWEAELPYERRALTLIQLNRLANYFVESGWLQDRCDESNRSHKDEIAEGRKFQAAANLYAMSDFLVKPLTDPAQFESVSQELRSAAQLLEPTRACCFAEVVHGAPPGVGVLVDIFVSHFWGHLFSRTLAAINAYRAGAAATDLSFWICLFAVNQHSIGDEVGASPNESPFNAALVAASGVVMVVDEDVHPFKRLWCLYEVERVHDLGLAFELIDEGGPIAASSLNMEKMKRVADSGIASPTVRQRWGSAKEFRSFAGGPGAEWWAKDAKGSLCDFDTKMSKLVAEPLLRAAIDTRDTETALRCIGWGAREAPLLQKLANLLGDLSVAMVRTRFSDEPMGLPLVMSYFGDVAGLRLLQAAGANLEARNAHGSTPALYAARNGHVKVLQLLKEAGADLRIPDENGKTPAHYAARNGHVKVLQLLREAGVDLGAADAEDRTPAHYAANNGQVEVLQLLREAGVDLEARKTDGFTLAHYAARSGHVKVLQLLREAGSDLKATDTDGFTPAHYAAQNGHAEVLQLLREAGAGLEVTRTNTDGFTPSRHAAQNGHAEVLDETGLDLASREGSPVCGRRVRFWS
ncbi:unnamed protein product [Polarella glacialis]|uniref:Uncharacterized protein n=1 Tax=Polarella glacialis TaxID=89957 RepID=A0A813FQ31_POLGL|nr:unnamed protein product [Polarella glacialis]